MSHLHIPDFMLNPIWLGLGYLITFLLLAVACWRLRGKDRRSMVPRLAVISAFNLVVMSIPLGFLPIHLNLTIFSGIVLGPWLGFISVFLVNFILGLIGHGGLTVVGLNTLAVGSEVFIGYLIFHFLIKAMSRVKAAAAATLMGLLVSTILTVSVLGLVNIPPEEVFHFGAEDYHAEEPVGGEIQNDQAVKAEVHDDQAVIKEDEHAGEKFDLSNFLRVAAPFLGLGIVLETLAVSGLVGFVGRVRPDIFQQESDATFPEETVPPKGEAVEG